jgi:hypothetical protein
MHGWLERVKSALEKVNGSFKRLVDKNITNYHVKDLVVAKEIKKGIKKSPGNKGGERLPLLGLNG